MKKKDSQWIQYATNISPLQTDPFVRGIGSTNYFRRLHVALHLHHNHLQYMEFIYSQMHDGGVELNFRAPFEKGNT